MRLEDELSNSGGSPLRAVAGSLGNFGECTHLQDWGKKLLQTLFPGSPSIPHAPYSPQIANALARITLVFLDA